MQNQDKKYTSPVIHAEQTLINAILDNEYPPGSLLPNERTLAKELNITRPTLREALKRMERDGWLCIRHGKPTTVNHFWTQGGLNVLSGITQFREKLPSNFIYYLLEIRIAVAPHYTSLAIQVNSAKVLESLSSTGYLDQDPHEFARFDWDLHHNLAVYSNNPVYTLILNGFKNTYFQLAGLYFQFQQAREKSWTFYQRLRKLAEQGNYLQARELTEETMRESLDLWKEIEQGEFL